MHLLIILIILIFVKDNKIGWIIVVTLLTITVQLDRIWYVMKPKDYDQVQTEKWRKALNLDHKQENKTND